MGRKPQTGRETTQSFPSTDRQSEAERLNANVITHGQESADWVAWARGEIRALQAQVEQLKGELSESDGDWVGIAASQARRAGQAEKREAALREALRELERLAIAEGGEDADLFPNENLVLVTVRRALSEQSEKA